MHDIYRTLDVLKAALGLPAIELNDDGQAEIGLREGFVAHVSRIDDEALELSFRLPGLDYPSTAMMRAMLGANLLGSSTDAGRLAIDVDKDEVVYCERWVVSDMNETAIQRRFAAFLDTGAFWLTDGTDTLVRQTRDTPSERPDAPPPVEAGSAESPYMIRL